MKAVVVWRIKGWQQSVLPQLGLSASCRREVAPAAAGIEHSWFPRWRNEGWGSKLAGSLERRGSVRSGQHTAFRMGSLQGNLHGWGGRPCVRGPVADRTQGSSWGTQGCGNAVDGAFLSCFVPLGSTETLKKKLFVLLWALELCLRVGRRTSSELRVGDSCPYR